MPRPPNHGGRCRNGAGLSTSTAKLHSRMRMRCVMRASRTARGANTCASRMQRIIMHTARHAVSHCCCNHCRHPSKPVVRDGPHTGAQNTQRAFEIARTTLYLLWQAPNSQTPLAWLYQRSTYSNLPSIAPRGVIMREGIDTRARMTSSCSHIQKPISQTMAVGAA